MELTFIGMWVRSVKAAQECMVERGVEIEMAERLELYSANIGFQKGEKISIAYKG